MQVDSVSTSPRSFVHIPALRTSLNMKRFWQKQLFEANSFYSHFELNLAEIARMKHMQEEQTILSAVFVFYLHSDGRSDMSVVEIG